MGQRATSFVIVVILLCLCSLAFGCGTVTSVVPGLGGNEPGGDRQHLPVSPEEAIAFLREIAPPNGWEVVATGDEFDIHGPRGKFFRLETTRMIGGKKTVSGVFYSKPGGCYVTISEKVGLPEALVEPLIAAIKAERGMASAEP